MFNLDGLEAGGGGLEAAGGGLEAAGGVVNMDGLEIFVEGEDGDFTRFKVEEEWDHV